MALYATGVNVAVSFPVFGFACIEFTRLTDFNAILDVNVRAGVVFQLANTFAISANYR